nr:glycosyltransferase family 61 protein [Synechococcus sp. CCY 9618]
MWDPQASDIVVEALHAVRTPPRRQDADLDDNRLAAAVPEARNGGRCIEGPAIFGGNLIKHFGHFLHECLGRLWWLGDPASLPASAREPARELISGLRDGNACVHFFVSRWLEPTTDLSPYMDEVLVALGLPRERIRILREPVRFEQLLIPAQSWGFDYDEPAWNAHLGCDCRRLMRSLLAGYRIPAEAEAGRQPAPEKLYVSRSGLPMPMGRLIGDVVLDRVLTDAGYGLYQPERHSIADQIRSYSQARDLVFMDGSALYLLWFSRLRPGTRISVILRRREGHWMCAQLRRLLPETPGLRWRVLDALIGERLTSEKDWESHNLADIASLARQLVPAGGLSPEVMEPLLASYVEAVVDDCSDIQVKGILRGLIHHLLVAPGAAVRRRAWPGARLRQRLGRLLRRVLTFR